MRNISSHKDSKSVIFSLSKRKNNHSKKRGGEREDIFSQLPKRLAEQKEGEKSLRNQTFERYFVLTNALQENGSVDNFENLNNVVATNVATVALEKKPETSLEYLKENLTSVITSKISGFVDAILGSRNFSSLTETVIEQKELIVDGMTYRMTIERVGAAKEIDATDYMSFNFRHEVQSAKQAWIRILEKVIPTQRKIAMFRITREILDIANHDVEILREELEEKLLSPEERAKRSDLKTEPMKKWVDRNSDDVAQFMLNNWGMYKKCELVNRANLRKYDPTFSTLLDKSYPHLLSDIPKIEDIGVREVQALEVLGYSKQNLSRLSSKAHR